MKKAILPIILAVVVVGAGAFWFLSRDSEPENTDQSTTSPSQVDEADNRQAAGNNQAETNTDTATPSAAEEVVITVSSNGFSPRTVTVKAGQTIKIVNNTNDTVDFASDDHPTHTIQSELNVGDIEPGESATFTVESVGTWGYHDHNNDSLLGTIIVK